MCVYYYYYYYIQRHTYGPVYIPDRLPKDHTLLGEEGGGLAGGDVFTLIDVDSISGGSGGSGSTRAAHMPPPAPEITSGLAQHRRSLEEQFKTRVAKDSIAITLEPGVKVCLLLLLLLQ